MPEFSDDPDLTPKCTPSPRKRNAGAVEAAVVALAGGATVPDAAKTAGISLQTLKRWRKDPRFQARVTAKRTEILAEATDKLTANMTKAAGKLGELIDCPDPKVGLAASGKTLELGLKVREQLELSQRIADLEAKLSKAKR